VNLALLGLGLATIGIWVPVAAGLLVLRGDIDPESVPKPMRVVGIVSVAWLSWVTGPVIRAWQRVRSSTEGGGA